MNKNFTKDMITIRRPEEKDVNGIHDLIKIYVKEAVLIPVPKLHISNKLKLFFIASIDNKIVGCARVRDYGDELFEIRSLAIHPDYKGLNIGSQLVKKLIKTLKSHKNARFFALTLVGPFFEKLGFKYVNKDLFPQKIWTDCKTCSKKNNCDEDAFLYIPKRSNN